MSGNILQVENLRTYFHQYNGIVKAVDGVDFNVREKQVLGLVGESGCGKSITARSIMRLVPKPHGKIESGKILFSGKNGNTDNPVDLTKLSPVGDKMRSIRGNEIGMIFQEPMTSLNPVFTLGNQIMESIRLHQKLDKKAAKEKVLIMLERVRMPNPIKVYKSYPHELSGGMRQRGMIAMALSCDIRLLIADEPTTALDVTIQAKILNLMLTLQEEMGMSIIMITHDLGVIAEICHEVVVMYLGRVVEYGDVDSIFHDPKHPYLIGLLKSMPALSMERKERLEPIQGTVPENSDMLKGCKFQPRCPQANDRCRKNEPQLVELPDGHKVRCWLYDE